MDPKEMLREATILAFNAHEGQVDKAGKPYFLHPFTVAMRVLSEIEDNELAAAGMLHDIIEDTEIQPSDLAECGMSERIIDTVCTLSRRKKEDYLVYLARVAIDPDAKKIKIIDLLENLREDRLSLLDEKTRDRLERKYQAALYFLRR